MKKIFFTTFVLINLVLVSQAQQNKHTVGEKFGGGVVFFITDDGLHGLIAETIDQGKTNFKQAEGIAKTGIHSIAGKGFSDWRMPTKIELNNMYLQKNIIGGFTSNTYWSSTVNDNVTSWAQNFSNGFNTQSDDLLSFCVRAVRAF